MNLHEILKSASAQMQEISQALNDLHTLRSIENAFGLSLDGIGEIIGELRAGREDDEYRAAIKFRIGINISSGQPETIISVTKSATEASFVQYQEIYPAKVLLTVNGGIPPSGLKIAIQKILPAGVGLEIDYIMGGLPFVFAGDNDGLGFSEVNWANEGGILAEHLT